MFTRLLLKNFKGWEDTGSLRLAPITVFFGSNSSGKTSLLQAILLLKQTAGSGRRFVFLFDPVDHVDGDVRPGPGVQEEVQTALIKARPGTVIEFAAGKFEFTRTLSLAVSGVTVRGQGKDKTILSLDPLVCPCSTMFRIDAPHLAWVLENLVAGTVVNQIVVDPQTAGWARTATRGSTQPRKAVVGRPTRVAWQDSRRARGPQVHRLRRGGVPGLINHVRVSRIT